MKNMKTIIYSLSLLLLYGCPSKANNEADAQAEVISLPVMTIEATDVETFKAYPATIEGVRDIEIRAQVDGYLTQLYVQEGAYVKKGQALFKIDELPYRTRYNDAMAQLNAAENGLVNAQLEVEKLIPLMASKLISDYDLKTAETNCKIAQAGVAQAKSMLAAAKIQLDFTLIKAPISGYLSRMPKKIGSLVSAMDSEALTQLSDVQQVYAYFSLSELDFVHFKAAYAGRTLEEKIRQLPPVSLLFADKTTYTEKGKIDMVNGQFDKTTGAISLRAVFPNAAGLIRSGNTGQVQLSLQQTNVLSIPQSTTVEIQDKTFVYVLDTENKVRVQAIQVLGRSGTDYLLQDGLRPGSRIVTKGFDTIADGDTINPIAEVTQ